MGFSVDERTLNPKAWDWQRKAVAWAVARGRAALFEDCGLGKTLQQLMWAEQIVKRGGSVLLLCPFGVRKQTVEEASAFGISVSTQTAESQDDVSGDGIYVTNYEKLHKFDHSKFVGVVLDESSCIKEFKSQTRRDLCGKFAETPYRLACTATPAPNEWMELGNHAEFLGVMPSNEMLSRWFINDSMKAGEYRLLDHAAEDFWRWVCGWALCLSKPSDMGDYSDEGFSLPEINYTFETVETPLRVQPGELFPTDAINVQTMHREKRESCEARAKRAAKIVATKPDDYWVVWCDTDYEADQLMEFLPPETIEVRGSMPNKKKEFGISEFSHGRARIIVTKPEIAGFGLNWQHCCNAVFVGLSYSFERFYQAVRRIWRFGQKRKVNIHIVQGEAEGAIADRVLRKQNAHLVMQASMTQAMFQYQIELLQGDRELAKYQPKQELRIPAWLQRKAASLTPQAEQTGPYSMATAAR